MKKKLGVLFIISLLIAGCGGADSHGEETTQHIFEVESQEVETETKGSWVSFTYGDVMEREDIAAVFKEDSVERVAEDRLLTLKSNYAEAEVKRVNDNSLVHRVRYSSEVGSVSGIELSIDTGTGLIPNAQFYEADMNGDGYKDLIITYISTAGTGYSESMYIYDFKAQKGMNVSNFTQKQEQDILSVYRQWCIDGFVEIRDINLGQLEVLYSSGFHPKPVIYNGEMAIYVRFSPPYPCKWTTYGTGCVAILTYDEGEYVLDRIWVEGEYRTDMIESIDGAEIGTSRQFPY